MERQVKSKLVFIAIPAIGNLVPAVEFGRRLMRLDPRLSATFLIVTVPQRDIVNTYVESRSAASISSSDHDVDFVHLPMAEPPSPDEYGTTIAFISLYIQKHAPAIKQAISELQDPEVNLVGLFLDMFSTTIADVANEMSIPFYVFFASPASFLGFMFYLSAHKEDTEFILRSEEEDVELNVPSFSHPLPKKVLPSSILASNDTCDWLVRHTIRYMDAKGIAINTFMEIEPHSLNALAISAPKLGELPPVYPVGPILDLDGPVKWHPEQHHQQGIMEWLNRQPESSVVFLCFGSMGSLSVPQVQEIARGLESCGVRFLWSLREPPKTKLHFPSDYSSVEEVLPPGFIQQTSGRGIVCGWAPQVTVLGHRAVGGFVSHCGWNSILESLWHGVPIATWPIYAEQQMNAFQMVVELGLAVEIRLDYREGHEMVAAEELERALRHLMAGDSEVRRKVDEMKEKSRMAMAEGGSSHRSSQLLIERIMGGF